MTERRKFSGDRLTEAELTENATITSQDVRGALSSRSRTPTQNKLKEFLTAQPIGGRSGERI